MSSTGHCELGMITPKTYAAIDSKLAELADEIIELANENLDEHDFSTLARISGSGLRELITTKLSDRLPKIAPVDPAHSTLGSYWNR